MAISKEKNENENKDCTFDEVGTYREHPSIFSTSYSDPHILLLSHELESYKKYIILQTIFIPLIFVIVFIILLRQ